MLLAGILLSSIQISWMARDEVSQRYVLQLEHAVESGDTQAEVCLGEAKQSYLLNKENPVEALVLYHRAAAQGNKQAKELILQMLMDGEGGLKQDTSSALDGFHALVKEGYLPAATNIGAYYLSRKDPTESDYQNALSWFKKGALGGDPFAAVAIGSMYASGLGVPKSRVIAQQWINKAADGQVACLVDFMELSDDIIEANVILPKNLDKQTSNFVVVYRHKDRKSAHPVIVYKSNNPDFDRAWLAALKNSKLPPWPKKFNPKNYYVGLKVTTRFYSFMSSIYRAINDELVMPKPVLLHGSKGTGKTDIVFDYLDGKVSHIELKNSSGDDLEDSAALQAVKDAKYPLPPEKYAGKRLRLMAPVDFNVLMSPKGTKLLPAAVLIH